MRKASSKAAYTYRPLTDTNSAIRLLRIVAARFEEDIIIELKDMSFEDGDLSADPYEALSYAWGSLENPGFVFIRHDDQLFSLSVTRNCEEALRYLRYRHKARTVWIDAICINQQDPREKAQQVSIMRSIYSKASQVIVWLGPASTMSSAAMTWIATVGNEIFYDETTWSISALTKDTTRVDAYEVIASTAELNAFAELIDKPYFDRLWIWQEVRSGGEKVTLKCGHDEVPWEWFTHTVQYWNLRDVPRSFEGRSERRVSFLLSIVHLHQRDEYFAAINSLRACRCTDQRDRVYATEAFFKGKSLLGPVDYEKSVQWVYSMHIMKSLGINRNLDFLIHVGDDAFSPGAEQIGELPS